MGRVISGICDFVCVCVHALKEKPLELSTLNFVWQDIGMLRAWTGTIDRVTGATDYPT